MVCNFCLNSKSVISAVWKVLPLKVTWNSNHIFLLLLQVVKNPVENGIEMVLDNIQQLRTVINRIRADSSQSTNPLTMKLNGTLDAAVNGGVSKFEVWHF